MVADPRDAKDTHALARLHVEIYGRVQGVGFRYFVQRRARSLGISGWVRNRWDGSVELEAEGPRDALERLLEAVRQGPSGARVQRVDAVWGPYTGQYDGFEVRFW
ncbi:MAG TPA: acylphosphatase [Caldilineae bacterium]|nr:acylphosphatase [Caldilineae bacterium]